MGRRCLVGHALRLADGVNQQLRVPPLEDAHAPPDSHREVPGAARILGHGVPGGRRCWRGPAGRVAVGGPRPPRGRHLPLPPPRGRGPEGRRPGGAAGGEARHRGQDRRGQVHAREPPPPAGAARGDPALQRRARAAGRAGRGPTQAGAAPPRRCTRAAGASDLPHEPEGQPWRGGAHRCRGSHGASALRPGCKTADRQGYLGGGHGVRAYPVWLVCGAAADAHDSPRPRPEAKGIGP
mmetsp:Transcript_64871/g.200918  ORF Transcript_64871/g.200918 Transcript_64871/m.200918 type:complete len:238 (+) Transcript_64871:1089-1802(+)